MQYKDTQERSDSPYKYTIRQTETHKENPKDKVACRQPYNINWRTERQTYRYTERMTNIQPYRYTKGNTEFNTKIPKDGQTAIQIFREKDKDTTIQKAGQTNLQTVIYNTFFSIEKQHIFAVLWDMLDWLVLILVLTRRL